MASIINVDKVRATGSTTDGLVVDSAGRVTQPANPVFIVYATGSGWTSITSGTEYSVPWNSERVDVGSNFSTSTYQWTAPIDCVMMFGAQFYMDASTANYTRMRLYEDSTIIHEQIADAPEVSIPEGALQSTVLLDVTSGSTYQWKLLKDGTSPQIYMPTTGTNLRFTYCWGYMVG